MTTVDFTNCKRILGKAYNGANGKKIAIEYEGSQYMLKFPPSAEKQKNDMSYSNSCYSEHIASTIFNMIGIAAHETMLGIFWVNGKEKVVCACKDFTAGGKQLFDFCSIKNTVIDSEHGGTGTELDDLQETIEKQQYVNPQVLLEHFWNVFIVDALLGNFDRHNGNWGFLFDVETQTAEIAPVYDCGSCLLPQADERVMKNVLENEDELNARVYQFPQSMLKMNGRKINYYDFLMSLESDACKEALMRIYPKIDIGKIKMFIQTVPYITEQQKKFYMRYIEARYEKILKPAYQKAMQMQDNV
ncbi:MAG: HipA domain-containing protein [Peptococcaceae bacterium]|nr:HipA domain-containing protein [Peptococcaceae bacterium]